MKKDEEKKEQNRSSTEHIVEFNRPKNNEIGSNDARLNELVAQSHLSVIIKLKS